MDSDRCHSKTGEAGGMNKRIFSYPHQCHLHATIVYAAFGRSHVQDDARHWENDVTLLSLLAYTFAYTRRPAKSHKQTFRTVHKNKRRGGNLCPPPIPRHSMFRGMQYVFTGQKLSPGPSIISIIAGEHKRGKTQKYQCWGEEF